MQMKSLAVLFTFLTAAVSAQAVVLYPAIAPRYSGAEIGEWTMDHEAALAKAKEGTNNVVVLFTGAWWCPHCQALENSTLTNPAWLDYVQSNKLYLVMIDNPGRANQYWCWLRETNYVENVAGLTLEQAQAEITNRYALQTSYAVPGATTNTVNGVSYLRVGYPTLIGLRPDGSRLGRFSPLVSTVSLEMVLRNMSQIFAADPGDEADNYYQGATILETPLCEDEEVDVGQRSLSETDAADWYAFDATAGFQWSFAFRAAAAGITNEINVQIFSHPTNTASLAERSMTPSDIAVLSYVIPQSGRYWLKVSRMQNLTQLLGYRLGFWFGTPPATVVFAEPQVSVSENAPAVSLTVNITGSENDAEVHVGYETVAGSAQPGQDFVESSGELMWTAGPKQPKAVTIPLLSDSVWEGDETFRVILYAVKNCSVGEQLSSCTVVLKEQAARVPGQLGFAGTNAFVLAEGSNMVFTVQRTGGSDGVVSARVDHVQGTLKTAVAQLVWTNAQTAAKSFAFAFTNEPGYQADRTSSLKLTPLGGSTLPSSAAGTRSLIRRDDLVVQTFMEFASEPANAGLGLKQARGTWFYGYCANEEKPVEPLWLRSEPVKANDYATLNAVLTGPGLLSFDWRSIGSGLTFQCWIGSALKESLDAAGVVSGVTLAVPAGRQTVAWTAKRVSGATGPESVGAVRGLVWTSLPQAATPEPRDKSVIINRNVTLRWQDVLATVSGLSGVTRHYELYAGVSISALSKIAELADAVYPRDGNAGDRAVLDGLIAQANARPVYWRVDTVMTDTAGRPTRYTGAIWSVTVLPEGAPEFVAAAGCYDPGLPGGAGVALPELTVGVYAEAGPFAASTEAGDAVSAVVKNGALPSGMKVEARAGRVWMTGVPKKAGAGTADLHVSVKRTAGSGTVTVPGTSVCVAWTVKTLGRAAGQFNGHRMEQDLSAYGNASLTVAESGKLSGKFVKGGRTFAFSAVAFGGETNGGFFVKAVAAAGTNRLDAVVYVSQDGALGEIRNDGSEETDYYMLWRNNWKEPEMAEVLNAYKGYYTLALPVKEASSENAPQGTGYLTLTVKTDGSITYAGELADGKRVSGSTPLLYGPDCCSAQDRASFYVFSVPAGYGESGGLFGLCELAAGNSALPTDNTVMLAEPRGLRWVSLNPQAVFGYNPATGELPDGIAGFTNVCDAAGGYYDKTINLQTFYAGAGLSVGAPLSAPGDFDGAQGVSGFTLLAVPEPGRLSAVASSPNALTFPRSVLAMNGSLVDVDQSTNPWGLSVSPIVATGLLSGSYTLYYQGLDGTGQLRQKTKRVSLKGVFVPVRGMTQNVYADWMGYYLITDHCRYLNTSGTEQNYSFNWSYSFSLAPEHGED